MRRGVRRMAQKFGGSESRRLRIHSKPRSRAGRSRSRPIRTEPDGRAEPTLGRRPEEAGLLGLARRKRPATVGLSQTTTSQAYAGDPSCPGDALLDATDTSKRTERFGPRRCVPNCRPEIGATHGRWK